MAGTRYSQLCPIARAAEIVGERWTLLVLRELCIGPRRFTDLRDGLPGVSASVLAERLQGLEQHGLVEQRDLPRPAASRVYALTEAGAAFEPALRELARWGLRFMFPLRPDDQIDASQARVACVLFARPSASPDLAVQIECDDDVFRALGGPAGTHIEDGPGPHDLRLKAPAMTIVMAASGMLAPDAVRADAAAQVDGDAARLDAFPDLFDFFGKPLDAAPTEETP